MPRSIKTFCPIKKKSFNPQRDEDMAFYTSRRWRRCRIMYLKEFPLCECGCGKASEVAHHKIDRHERPDLAYDWGNLQALTASCHSKLSVNRRKGNSFTLEKRIVVCGPPASGKTTWVESRRQQGDLVWDYDALTNCFFNYIRHAPFLCNELMAKLSASCLSYIATHPKQSFYWIVTDLSKAREIARKTNAQLKVMDTLIEICIQRCVEREQGKKQIRVIEQWFKEIECK